MLTILLANKLSNQNDLSQILERGNQHLLATLWEELERLTEKIDKGRQQVIILNNHKDSLFPLIFPILALCSKFSLSLMTWENSIWIDTFCWRSQYVKKHNCPCQLADDASSRHRHHLWIFSRNDAPGKFPMIVLAALLFFISPVKPAVCSMKD